MALQTQPEEQIFGIAFKPAPWRSEHPFARLTRQKAGNGMNEEIAEERRSTTQKVLHVNLSL
jgi:hypothetical protein